MNKHWPRRKSKYNSKKRKLTNIRTRGDKHVLFYRKEENIMERFWDLLKTSVIVQSIITLVLVATCCYLWATGQAVPDNLWTALTIVLGFFFGAKVQQKLGG